MDIKRYDKFYRDLGQYYTKSSSSVKVIVHIQDSFDDVPIFKIDYDEIQGWRQAYIDSGDDSLFANDIFLTNHHTTNFPIVNNVNGHTTMNIANKKLISTDIKVGSIREYANFKTGKYAINNVSIKISDYQIVGERFANQKTLEFSDYLIDYINNNTLINKPVTIYYYSNVCSSIWSDCPPIYYGYIRDFNYDNNSVTLRLEDLSEQKFHKDVPVQTVSSVYKSNNNFTIPEKYVNTPIPMIYGHMPNVKVPFVVEDTVHGYQKTTFLIDRIEQAQLGGSWWEDEDDSNTFNARPNLYEYLWTYLQVKSDNQYASIFPEATYTYPPDMDGTEYSPSYLGTQYTLDQSSNNIEFYMPSKSEASFMPDGEETEWFWDRNTFYNQVDCLMIRKAKGVSYNNNIVDIRGVKPSTVDPDFITTFEGQGEFNIFVDENNVVELETYGASSNIIKHNDTKFVVQGSSNSSPFMGTHYITEKDPTATFEGQETTGSHDSYEWKTQLNDVHISVDFEDAGSFDWINGVTTLIGMFQHTDLHQDNMLAGHRYNHAGLWSSKQTLLNVIPSGIGVISTVQSFSAHGREMNTTVLNDLSDTNAFDWHLEGRFGWPEYWGGSTFEAHRWIQQDEVGYISNKKFKMPFWRIDSNFLNIQCIRDTQAISGLSLDDLLNPTADGFSSLAEGVINNAMSSYCYVNFYSSFFNTPTGSHYVSDSDTVFYNKDMSANYAGYPSQLEGYSRWWQLYNDNMKGRSTPFTTLCSGSVVKSAQYVLDENYPEEDYVKNIVSPYNWWWENQNADGPIRGNTDNLSYPDTGLSRWANFCIYDSDASSYGAGYTGWMTAYDNTTDIAVKDEPMNNDFGRQFNNMFDNVLWHDYDGDGVNDNCGTPTAFWQSAIFNMLHPDDPEIASDVLSNLHLFYDNSKFGEPNQYGYGTSQPSGYPNTNWNFRDAFGNYEDLVTVLDWRAPEDYNAIKLSYGPSYAPVAQGGYWNNGLTKWMQPGFRAVDITTPFMGTSYGRLEITYLGVAHRCLLEMPLIEQDYYMNSYGRVGIPETTDTQLYNYFTSGFKLNPQNPVDVLHDIMVQELGYSSDRINLESKANAFNEHYGWKLEFALTKQMNSKKLIEDICKSFKTIARINYNGDLDFVTLNEYYTNQSSQETTAFKWINTFDIFKAKKHLTPLQDIKTRVKVLYAYDEDTDLYNEDTGYCYADFILDDDGDTVGFGSGGEGYNLSYYSLPEQDSEGVFHPDSTLEFKTKYIQDRYTAKQLRNFLMYQNCNQHTILKLNLPISYFHLEVGEVIKLSKQLKKGQNKLDNIEVELDSFKKNGQWVYPGYIITSINRKTDSIDIEAMQLHQLNNEATVRWQPEDGDIVRYGCMDEDAINYDPNANQASACYYLGDINNDGGVSVADVTLLNDYLLGNVALSPAQLLAADINQDGVVNESDLILLEDIVTGQIEVNEPPLFTVENVWHGDSDNIWLEFYDVIRVTTRFINTPIFTKYELMARAPQYSNEWVTLKEYEVGENIEDYENIDFTYNETFHSDGNYFDPYSYSHTNTTYGTSEGYQYNAYHSGDIVLGPAFFQQIIPNIDWNTPSMDGYYLGSWGTTVELKVRATNMNIINEQYQEIFADFYPDVEPAFQVYEQDFVISVNSGTYLDDVENWWQYSEQDPANLSYAGEGNSDVNWFGNFKQLLDHSSGGRGFIDVIAISEQTTAYMNDAANEYKEPWTEESSFEKLPWSLMKDPSEPFWSQFDSTNSNTFNSTTESFDYAQNCYDLNIGIHSPNTGFGLDWETSQFESEDFYENMFFNNNSNGAPLRHTMCAHTVNSVMDGTEDNEKVSIELMTYQDGNYFNHDKVLMKNCRIYPLIGVEDVENGVMDGHSGIMPLGEYGLYPDLDEPPIGFPFSTKQDPYNPRNHPDLPTNYPDNWINYAPEGNHNITDGSRVHVKDIWNLMAQESNAFKYGTPFVAAQSPGSANNTSRFFMFRLYGDLDTERGGLDIFHDLLGNSTGLVNTLETSFGGLYDDDEDANYGNNYNQNIMPFLTYGWPFTLRVRQRFLEGNTESERVEELTLRVVRTGNASVPYNNFNYEQLADGVPETWGEGPSGIGQLLPNYGSWLNEIWQNEADAPRPYPDPDPPTPGPDEPASED